MAHVASDCVITSDRVTKLRPMGRLSAKASEGMKMNKSDTNHGAFMTGDHQLWKRYQQASASRHLEARPVVRFHYGKRSR